jgi:predicted murein hydrolase (TIGR00659 family)
MPDLLVHSPLLGVTLTVILFYLGEKLAAYLKTSLLPPLCTSSLVIILLISFTNLFTFEDYQLGGSLLGFMLGPAIIALALPLKKNWELLRNNLGILVTTTIFGAVMAIIVNVSCARFFGVSQASVLSMIPKSVTAPIAMELSAYVGGIPPLTILSVTLAGFCGAIFGHKLLALVGVTNDIAIGFAIGTGSHALGTSTCISINSTQTTFSSLALILMSIATTLVVPILLPFLK